jgi:hypothetical protein
MQAKLRSSFYVPFSRIYYFKARVSGWFRSEKIIVELALR